MKTRSAKLSEHIKRAGQTPPASVIIPEANSAPGLSPQSRSRRLEGLEVIPDKSTKSSISNSNAATPPTPSANDEEGCHELTPPEKNNVPNEFDQPVPVSQDYKTPESIHPVQPDSVPSVQPPYGGSEDPNHDQPRFRHETRPTNSSDFQRDPKIRIDFPKSSDVKRWKELNLMLADALPKIFDPKRIRHDDVDTLIEDFDNWLHAFFLQHCGPIVVVPPTQRSEAPTSKRHRGLERLRQQKSSCKKAFKVLKKAGLCFSIAGQKLKELWLKLVRRHNKLRCKVSKQKTQWQKVQAERAFKRDPHKYAQNLFKGESLNGSPTFSQEEGEAYFQTLYHDECRSEDFSPLEGMERPPPPTYPFFKEPPTFREVKRHTRSKRGNACPGLNTLPYLIYKKCDSILRTAHQIFLKIFRDKDIPRDWAIAFVVLLQKLKDVLDQPSEFRPIAITNTLGKIFSPLFLSGFRNSWSRTSTSRPPSKKGFWLGCLAALSMFSPCGKRSAKPRMSNVPSSFPGWTSPMHMAR